MVRSNLLSKRHHARAKRRPDPFRPLYEWWLANPKGRYDDAHRGTQLTADDGSYRFETDFPRPTTFDRLTFISRFSRSDTEHSPLRSILKRGRNP